MALATAGLPPHEIDSYKYFAGNGAKELIRKSLIADGDTELVHFDSVMEAYNRIFEEYCMYEVKPYDGIRELLKALKEKGLHLAVNSNKPQPRTVDVVEAIFGKDTFDLLVGQCEERRRKPAPDGVNYILEQLHGNTLDPQILHDALRATAHKRGTERHLAEAAEVFEEVENSSVMQKLWESYRKKFSYAADLEWSIIMGAVRSLYALCEKGSSL